MDVTLTERDAPVVLEELLPAQTQSYQLGMKLKLEIHEIEAIHTKYLDPRDRLLHIILAFLRQAEPRPTWRVIVDALRNPAVNLTALAEKVEAVHFPDPTATRLSSSGQVSAADSSVVEQCEVYFGKRSLKNEVIYSSSFIVTLTGSPLHSVD